MNSERFSNVGGSGNLPPEELVERFKDAFADENLQEFYDCVAQWEQAMENGKDKGAAFMALIEKLKNVFVFHADILKKWVDEEPLLREALRKLIAGLATLRDDLEDS